MKAIRTFCVSFVGVSLFASMAIAKPVSDGASAPIEPLPKATLLADNVVVTPGTTTPPPAPTVVTPAPSTTVVEPAPVAPATRKTVVTENPAPKNYMSTIAVSALMGGVAGALIGGAIYYLGDQEHPRNVVYWAAGGVLVGTGMGLVQVMVQENRADAAVARLPSDPAPTFRVALLKTTF
jgi:hypothetical protein